MNEKGQYLYDVRKIFRFFLPPPGPACHIQNSRNLLPFVCFFGTPLQLHPLRTSYKYAPKGRLSGLSVQSFVWSMIFGGLRICIGISASFICPRGGPRIARSPLSIHRREEGSGGWIARL